ncbi:hypothetical protein J437_LFUL018293 [Ladona fulva]|uniref:PiggyBac transposable element-derived protein domain-containing protein n=1 Tax=Ladona fulva TaxID=123851 RepID=A0A8K0KQY7_LADFU|nr:hypothetical protein J437_LFUL018293 [Ladona fulva]
MIRTPIFGELMSRDRYLMILQMLHFSDNNVPSEGDWLHKIRPVADPLCRAFKNTLVPFQNLCINESLMLFKGRLFFKQYPLQEKSIWHQNLHYLLLSKLRIWKIWGHRLYLDKLGKWTYSYVDNWYTSPSLFCWLHNRATNACGTVRKNRRNLPKMEEKLKKGEIKFKSSEKLLALKWCSKNEVWMPSTCHRNQKERPADRRNDKKSPNVWSTITSLWALSIKLT